MKVQLYTWIVQTLIQTFLQTIFSSGKRFRVFVFGDYEFQCHMYGLSGAQGNQSDYQQKYVHVYCT